MEFKKQQCRELTSPEVLLNGVDHKIQMVLPSNLSKPTLKNCLKDKTLAESPGNTMPPKTEIWIKPPNTCSIHQEG